MKTWLVGTVLGLVLVACSPTSSSDADSDPSADTSPVVDRGNATPVDATNSAEAVSQATTDGAAGEAPTVLANDADASAGAGDKAVSDAIDNNLGDHEKYQAVIKALQNAVAAADAASVAALVDYPISVEIDGKATIIKDERDFVARYKGFMTAQIANAIVATKYSDLLVNSKGVMFGQGQAWLNGICKDDACKALDVKLVTLQPSPE